jgi:hypothetical protein
MSGKRIRQEELKLSNKGLCRTGRVEIEDFCFIVGGREFECNRFSAAFVSESVTRMLLSDGSVDSFVVSDFEDSSAFEVVMKLIEGGFGELTEKNCSSLDIIEEKEELTDAITNFRFGQGQVCYHMRM